MKQEISFTLLSLYGTEVEVVQGTKKYKILLDPRLKLTTNRGCIKAKKLKVNDTIIYNDHPLYVVKVYNPKITLITFDKVRHEYPKIECVRDKDCKFFSSEELLTFLKKSDYKYAIPMYDGISLESDIPGYTDYFPGSVLNEDEESIIEREDFPLEMWRF